MATKKLIYFTAGATPTVAEAAAITALNTMDADVYDIQVRNAAITHTHETCDLVAGTIPTAYNGDAAYGLVDAARPLCFDIWPKTHTMAAVATLQTYSIKVTGDISALVRTNVTASTAGTTYATSDGAKATVSAEGIVTAVATGTATITATHTYASAKTTTSTMVITVS